MEHPLALHDPLAVLGERDGLGSLRGVADDRVVAQLGQHVEVAPTPHVVEPTPEERFRLLVVDRHGGRPYKSEIRSASRMRAAVSAISSSLSYLVRGQKKPRSPSFGRRSEEHTSELQ